MTTQIPGSLFTDPAPGPRLEQTARTQVVHGCPSAINRLLVLNGEPYPGRCTVLLLREAIGF